MSPVLRASVLVLCSFPLCAVSRSSPLCQLAGGSAVLTVWAVSQRPRLALESLVLLWQEPCASRRWITRGNHCLKSGTAHGFAAASLRGATTPQRLTRQRRVPVYVPTISPLYPCSVPACPPPRCQSIAIPTGHQQCRSPRCSCDPAWPGGTWLGVPQC